MHHVMHILAVSLIVVGCTEVVSKNEKSISIRYSNLVESEAFQIAEEHCATFGKIAVPTIPKSEGNRIATFECR